MKRQIGSLALVLFVFLPFATAGAAITWDGDFTTFRYDVNLNGGVFGYPPDYSSDGGDTQLFYYDPIQDRFDFYDSAALGDLVESFGESPGEVRMTAMAMGPAGGASPNNGVEVQTFTEVALTGLTTSNCLDVSQKAVTWVNRQFSVSSEEEYAIEASLSGLINFVPFHVSSAYEAIYSLSGEVVLTEIVGTWPNETFTELIALPLSGSTRDASVQITLVNEVGGKPVRYELRALITLETHLVNFVHPSLVPLGTFPGASYQLGTQSAPMVLKAKITSTNPLPIAIDIKPWDDGTNRINLWGLKIIPVAILSTTEFSAFSEVDQTSLTFGVTGDEDSLTFCARRAWDVNGDGLGDLLCVFSRPVAGFQCGDSEGILKGETVEGIPIEGTDSVRIVPCWN